MAHPGPMPRHVLVPPPTPMGRPVLDPRRGPGMSCREADSIIEYLEEELYETNEQLEDAHEQLDYIDESLRNMIEQTYRAHASLDRIFTPWR